ncbi:hypothetical protein KEM55_002120 [Ascosphaera atra]|nr:hypothetical protein KEM55_002120 [Ascosphaera atra]
MVESPRTPIGVRRKRNRPSELRNLKQTQRDNRKRLKTLASHLQKKVREARETGDEDSPSDASSALAALIKEKKRRKRPALSPLEQLPPELIEHIFLYCLECNLPLASPFLAAALSRESLYSALTLAAFWESAVGADERAIFSGASIRHAQVDVGSLLVSGKARLQGQILRCRWFDPQLLMALRGRLVKSFLDVAWFGKGIVMDDDEREKLDKTTNLKKLSHAHEASVFAGHNRDQHYQLKLTLDNRLVATVSHESASGLSNISTLVFPGYLQHVPDIRLRGNPWTPQRIAFLRDLVPLSPINNQGTMSFHRLDASKQAIQDGVLAAIDENKPDVLEILLKYYDLPSSPLQSSQDERPTECSSIQPSHFLAALYSPYVTEIMKILIRYGPQLLPYDDMELTTVAMEWKEQGDVFGSWLLDYMVEVPGRQAEKNPMFEAGEPKDRSAWNDRRVVEIFGELPPAPPEEGQA